MNDYVAHMTPHVARIEASGQWHCSHAVLTSSLAVADSARDLGVVIDSCLTMADHVSAIRQSGYFQLRQLRPVARSLTVDAAKTIVHAFIACRLDYCNSLLHGITDSLFRRPQSVQNAAARLITGDGYTATGSHHSGFEGPMIHWLPIRRRADYKMALLVYKSLHGMAPSYLAAWAQILGDGGCTPRLKKCGV